MYCQLIILAHNDAGFLQRIHSLVIALAVPSCSAYGCHKKQLSSLFQRLVPQTDDSRKKGPRHILMGAVAQHDIQKNNACGRVINGLLHALNALCRVNHGMRPALGVYIVPQIHHNMTVRL